MSDRFNISLGPLVITDTDGNPFYKSGDTPMVWSDASQGDVVAFEALVIKLMGDLNAMGAAKAQGKGRK